MRMVWAVTWCGLGLLAPGWGLTQEGEIARPAGEPAAVHPILAALDTDSDGVISARELRAAAKALQALDRNDDGELTADEYQGVPVGDAAGGGAAAAVHPLVAVLDADSDGTISARELRSAARALKQLDRNDDGQITPDELVAGVLPGALDGGAARGDRAGRGGRAGRPGGAGAGGAGAGGGFGGPGPGVAGGLGGQMGVPRGIGGGAVGGGGGFSQPPGAGLPPQLSKLMGFDQNRDGRVTLDEMPASLRGLFKMLDLNGDGGIDARELRLALRNPALRGNGG